MATIQIDDRRVAAPRRTRPSTDYWDHLTASWRTVGPIPVPRRGE
jgi:hypothetical protein